jgi:hypothetical protein
MRGKDQILADSLILMIFSTATNILALALFVRESEFFLWHFIF